MQQDKPDTAAPAPAPSSPRRGPVIIAVSQQKGGAGKTTTACNLAVALADQLAPRQVVVADLDPQGSAGQYLGATRPGQPPQPGETGLYEILTGRHEGPVADALRPTAAPGVRLLAAGPRLGMAEVDPILRDMSHLEMRRALTRGIGDVACILLDCAPGFGILNTLAQMAADVVLVPTPPLPFAEAALANTVHYIERLRADGRNRVGLLLTMSNADDPLHTEVTGRLREAWKDQVFGTSIPFDPAAERAAAAQVPVVLAEPRSAVAQAYLGASEELLGALEAVLQPSRSTGQRPPPPPPTAKGEPLQARQRPVPTAAPVPPPPPPPPQPQPIRETPAPAAAPAPAPEETAPPPPPPAVAPAPPPPAASPAPSRTAAATAPAPTPAPEPEPELAREPEPQPEVAPPPAAARARPGRMEEDEAEAQPVRRRQPDQPLPTLDLPEDPEERRSAFARPGTWVLLAVALLLGGVLAVVATLPPELLSP